MKMLLKNMMNIGSLKMPSIIVNPVYIQYKLGEQINNRIQYLGWIGTFCRMQLNQTIDPILDPMLFGFAGSPGSQTPMPSKYC